MTNRRTQAADAAEAIEASARHRARRWPLLPNMRDVTHEQSGKVSGSSVRSDRDKSKP